MRACMRVCMRVHARARTERLYSFASPLRAVAILSAAAWSVACVAISPSFSPKSPTSAGTATSSE